ncbi:Undecaprenyl-phosphate mannosyltransferase [Baekduia alba]|uniref:glycosyltransferase family 2 protein n=1 Tax=Baekduia alba TaxID=2997333 RepID=UPI002341A7B7|nr:glycosyltransferase family 2 protein [Baekduia alba]WCB95828.1 Undecaprenyl-phosphate mannosyltransferase [Baekduia alba]
MNVFVIPAYNEETNLPRLLLDLEERPGLWMGGHVIIVDDGSSDATADVAAAYDGPVPMILHRQVRNQGAGRAFDKGFRIALELCGDDDYVITMESDTTSDLDAVATMLAVAQEGTDIVLASHHGEGQLVNVSAHRRLLSRAAATAIRRGAGLDAKTVSSFFRVYRAAALRDAYARHGDRFIREAGFACKAEILVKMVRGGASVREVPVSLDWSRRDGESKMRVLPTIGGYARMMARQITTREPVETRERV